MFSLFGKKDKKPQQKPQDVIPPVLLALRETLYSNSSLEPIISRIKDDSKTIFPWSNFVSANQALKDGDNAKAISQLKQIAETQGLNTRIYLQAWHTLVSLGEVPLETLRGYTQGVIVENHMDQGLDIVAAYADYTARYWNYTGTGIVWEARDPEIDKLVFNLLSVGFEITKRIGVGLRDTPPVPQKGYVRIYVMAYDGSTLGEGLYDQLSKDQMGAAAIGAAFNLMTGLIQKQKNSQKSS